MSYTEREVEYLLIPLAMDQQINNPERAILQFEDLGTIDIGAYCYLRKSNLPRAPKINSIATGTLVDLASFDKNRVEVVRKIIYFISDERRLENYRNATVYKKTYYLNTFLNWADNNGFTTALTDLSKLHYTMRAFVAHLRERVNHNEITINSASYIQNATISVLTGALEIDNVQEGTKLLSKSNKATKSTIPPSEESQSKILSICNSIFEGIRKLVVERKHYPFSLSMPKYLGIENNSIWVFPANEWCQIYKGNEIKNNYRAYDYLNGRLATVDEISESYRDIKLQKTPRALKSYQVRKAKRAINAARLMINMANENYMCMPRQLAGVLAHNAFVLLFIANTGMNYSSVRQLLWNKTYEVGLERQGFRTIKYRAFGREVFFEIQHVFLEQFKRYLELRDYLLNGVKLEYLFMGFGQKSNKREIKQLSRLTMCTLYKSLLKFDPALPKIMPKQWRAGKSDRLLRTTDPATTSIVIQNSENTVLKSYAAGSASTHIEEMSDFFNQVTETVLNKEQTIENGIEKVVGVCTSYGTPCDIEGEVPLYPDCKIPEGCLFCNKFKIHADEKDTRKLVSCQYCLRLKSNKASNEEEFQRLFRPIFDRIQKLLKEIALHDHEMVERVRKEVEEDGDLDPYWLSKLEWLIELEFV